MSTSSSSLSDSLSDVSTMCFDGVILELPKRMVETPSQLRWLTQPTIGLGCDATLERLSKEAWQYYLQLKADRLVPIVVGLWPYLTYRLGYWYNRQHHTRSWCPWVPKFARWGRQFPKTQIVRWNHRSLF